MRTEISQEVVDNLLSITKNILGEHGVELLLNKVNSKREEGFNGKELVFMIGEEIQSIYGKNGGFAVFRQIGREVAKSLMEEKSRDEWEEIFLIALKFLGFAEGIQKFEEEVCICNCIFFPNFLEPSNIKPIEHAVCWGGLGFIEGFARELDRGVREVRWKDRDFQKNRCVFSFVRS